MTTYHVSEEPEAEKIFEEYKIDIEEKVIDTGAPIKQESDELENLENFEEIGIPIKKELPDVQDPLYEPGEVFVQYNIDVKEENIDEEQCNIQNLTIRELNDTAQNSNAEQLTNDIINLQTVKETSHISTTNKSTVKERIPSRRKINNFSCRICAKKFLLEKKLIEHMAISHSVLNKNQISNQAKYVLQSWFNAHVEHPHPTQAEKLDLSTQANITLRRVNHWFINARHRYDQEQLRKKEREKRTIHVKNINLVKSTMSWDNEKIINFIKEYEKRPILWKKSDKLYYNIVKKEDAWREISEIFNEDIALLKRKIESIRGSRRREKNRMVQSGGTGKGRKDIYISKWFAWDALQFLEDPEEIRATISNYAEEEQEVTEQEPLDNLEPTENIEPKEAADDTHDKADQIIGQQTKQPIKKKIFFSPKNPAPKRNRSEDPRINEAYNILQSAVTMNKKKDECTIFGEFVAAKLRKYDDRTRTILQHQVHNLLFQADMNVQQFPMPQQIQSNFIPMQPPIHAQQLTELQKTSTSSQYSSPRSDSALSHNYLCSPSPASSTASPLQSPQDTPQPQDYQNNSQSQDNADFNGLHDYFSSLI